MGYIRPDDYRVWEILVSKPRGHSFLNARLLKNNYRYPYTLSFFY